MVQPHDSLDALSTSLTRKVADFVQSRPEVSKACEDAFYVLDAQGHGTITLDQAAASASQLCLNLQAALYDFRVPVKRLTPQEIQAIFAGSGYDSDRRLTLEEFQAFYVKVLVAGCLKAGNSALRVYGMGLVGGVMGVFAVKRTIRAIPIVGLLASPFLAMLPSILVGPAVGAAVVFKMNKGDMSALRRKFFGPRITARRTRTI